MISLNQNREDSRVLRELAELKRKVKQVGLVEKLCKKSFQYDTKEHSEPKSNTETRTSERLKGESRATTAAVEFVFHARWYK